MLIFLFDIAISLRIGFAAYVPGDQYIHNLDPVAFEVFGRTVKWYGLSYILGIFACYLVLYKLAKSKRVILRPEDTSGFVIYAASFGVILGGRLGHVLLYNWENFIRNPTIFFDLSSGGMSSHGGIAGLVLFTWAYSRWKQLNWAALGDCIVAVAPLAVGIGRLANFVNGELWGKKCDPGLKWGVRFPTELQLSDMPAELLDSIPPPEFGTKSMSYILEFARSNPEILAKLGDLVDPRHPSQLYQAALEGFLQFSILITICLVFRRLPFGLLAALGFYFYAILRIIGEIYREPDLTDSGESFHFIGGLSAGQYYSLYMFIVGSGFLFYALRYGKRQ